jgi:hypothetical protein
VRELRYWARLRGFRTRVITLATTLMDAELNPLVDDLHFSITCEST